MTHFDSLIEKIKKKEIIFDLKINQVLFDDSKLSTVEKKDFLEKKLIHFRKSDDLRGYFFSLLALVELYSSLKLPNLTLMRELEVLSKSDYSLRNYFFVDYIFNLIEEGDIEGAKKRALNYLSFLDKNKLNERIIYLVSELDKKIRLDDWLYPFWLKALGRSGKLESFNNIYNRYKKYFLREDSSPPSWYKPLQELWEKKGVSWWSFSSIYLNKIIIDLESISKKESVLDCHNSLISIHKYLVIFGVEGDVYRGLFSRLKRKYEDLDLDLDFKLIKKKNINDFNKNQFLSEEKEFSKPEVFISGIRYEPFNHMNYSIDLNKDFRAGEKKILGFLKNIPFKRIEKNIMDWMVCFIQMKAFTILDYLTFSLEKNSRFSTLSSKKKLEYEYLVCEIYNLKEDWEKLLIRSLNILKSYDLMESDYLPIYYLKGEALLRLGRIKEAEEIFLEIRGKNPSFRVVSQRLEEIGKNK